VFSPTERNALYRAVMDGGADPDECDVIQDRSYLQIKHRCGSGLRLSDERNPDSSLFVIEMHMADGQVGPTYFEDRWKDVVYRVTDWARVVSDEAPDLWGQSVLKRRLLSAMEASDENTPFTESQRAEITDRLQHIEDQLREHGELTAAQLERVEEKFEDIKEASGRLGKKDWWTYTIGALTTLFVASTVTPDVANHILTTVVGAVAHLLGNLPPMLP
jgi:hypothetical protein